ncbi:PHP domain-containing protein [Moraxella nasibovis]|uniref:PHP domain-containing protein n=1 Tax=Moraxella nasibovis TaxID=2904120 RepID=UPI00240FC82E|nr:PHP domain-containing protein [Moraxella nasibovis]WFF38125.1 PHP domain-containing protein [Moraxella nasibovis]
MIDLHSHSTASDGTNTPTQLIQKAHLAGIDTFALTDHDTIAGVMEAKEVALNLGVRLIHGVEISCTHELAGGYGRQKELQKIIHVVALDFDDTKAMHDALQALQDSRHQRGRRIIEKLGEILADDDPDLTERLWQAVLAKAGNNPRAIGRAHIAQALFELGFVPSVQAAFDKYLADGKAAYVAIETISMQRTIRLIHECGGLAVLAHPTRYGLSATRTRKLIADFAHLGGDACELPNNEPDSLRAMIDRSIAEHGLLVSVGSDFHGENMPWRKLGAVAKVKSGQVGVWERFGEHGRLG